MTDVSNEEWFGDLSVDDDHAKIEEWEVADRELSQKGLTLEERHAFWRSLDPDTEIFDWYADLIASGLSDTSARSYIQQISEVCK